MSLKMISVCHHPPCAKQYNYSMFTVCRKQIMNDQIKKYLGNDIIYVNILDILYGLCSKWLCQILDNVYIE